MNARLIAGVALIILVSAAAPAMVQSPQRARMPIRPDALHYEQVLGRAPQGAGNGEEMAGQNPGAGCILSLLRAADVFVHGGWVAVCLPYAAGE